MNPAAIPIPQRLKVVVALIMAAGFGAAAAIYVSAVSRPAGSSDYEAEVSKQYLREMEVYGGKANVLASGLREWFVALWHGRKLAFTVAFLTILVALAVLFFSVPLPPPPGQRHTDGTPT